MNTDVDQSTSTDEPGPDTGYGELEEMGPIDYIVVEFPGNKMNGEAFPLLIDLVDAGTIRILDLLFVRRDSTARSRRWSSPTSTATASSTSRSSRAPPPDCSARTTSTRPRTRSNRQLGRHPALREHLGGTLRHGGAARWRPAGRQRSDSRPGDPGPARRGRGRGRLRLPPSADPPDHTIIQHERGAHRDARSPSRGRPHRGRRRYRQRGRRSGSAPSAGTLAAQEQPAAQERSTARLRNPQYRRQAPARATGRRDGRQARPAPANRRAQGRLCARAEY